MDNPNVTVPCDPPPRSWGEWEAWVETSLGLGWRREAHPRQIIMMCVSIWQALHINVDPPLALPEDNVEVVKGLGARIQNTVGDSVAFGRLRRHTLL